MLSIEVSTKCNLKCKNCFAHESGEALSEISFSNAKDIVTEGRKLGFSRLGITGGEPLLWKDTTKLIEHGINKGYSNFLINTNGHLLNDEICKKLSIFGDKLELSCTINGNETEHDSIRGKGSYKKAIKGIEIGLHYGLNIYVYSVVNRNNLRSIPNFTNYISKKFNDIKSIVFIQQRGIDNNYYDANLKLLPNEFIEMVKMLSYLSLTGFKAQILENSLSTVVAKKLGFNWFPESPEISRPGKIVVLSNGSITVNHSSHYSIGKYKKGSLSTAFNSKKYKRLTSKESELCLGCEFINLCRSTGKLRPSSKYHNVGSNDEYFCQKVLGLLNDR